MHAYKIPDTIFGASAQLETVLKTIVWLVGRDNEILFDGAAGCHLFESSRLLVQRTHISNDETRVLQCLLDGIPYAVLRVVKFDGHPPTWFEQSIVLFEAPCHQRLIFRKPFVLGLRLDCFFVSICSDLQPVFP